jgi:hypothetical protein
MNRSLHFYCLTISVRVLTCSPSLFFGHYLLYPQGARRVGRCAACSPNWTNQRLPLRRRSAPTLSVTRNKNRTSSFCYPGRLNSLLFHSLAQTPTLGSLTSLLCVFAAVVLDMTITPTTNLNQPTNQPIKTGNAWDSTVVVFLSDNGGIPEHGSSNYPFKGGKGTYYEGGVRVPCFLAGGFVNRALVSAGTTAGYATNSLV